MRRGRKRLPAPPGFYGCARCEQVKPVSDFHLHVSGPDGHASICKVCKQADRVAIRERKRNQPDATIQARFWPKVDKSGGPDACWNWLGALSNRGYGAIYYRGADQPAHRVMMELLGHTVDYSKKQVVDHICKNIRCVNPRHLRVVLQAENCGPLAAPTPHWLNAQKTACDKGHPYTAENTHWFTSARQKNPVRMCLTCYAGRHPTTRKKPNTRETARAVTPQRSMP